MKLSLIITFILVAFLVTTKSTVYSQPPIDPNVTYINATAAQQITLTPFMLDTGNWPFMEDLCESFSMPLCAAGWADELCPDTDNDGNHWSNWVPYRRVVVYHPSWPNCPIQMIATSRYCIFNPNCIQTHILHYHIRNTNYGSFICGDLYDYMNTGTPAQKQQKANQLLADLYGLFAKSIFTEHNALRETPMMCDDLNVNFEVHYFDGLCKGFCVYTSYAGESGTEIVLTLKPHICEQSACCKFIHHFCYMEDLLHPGDPAYYILNHNYSRTTRNSAECPGDFFTSECPYVENAVMISTYPCIESCDVEFLDLGD